MLREGAAPDCACKLEWEARSDATAPFSEVGDSFDDCYTRTDERVDLVA